MKREREVLFWLVKSTVFGIQLTEEQKNSITPEILFDAYKLAIAHSLSHLVLSALKSNGLTKISPEITDKAKSAVYFASITTDLKKQELKNISDIFEKNGISFIPLKGSVLADYYPERWMRISCDIDIYVRKEEFEKAHTLLIDQLKYRSRKVMTHDVLLIAQNKTHIELHYDLIEDKVVAESSKVLSEVWDYSKPKNENSYEYVMSDEMFYFYHIAHMAKHFSEGGCGLRSLLDLYILNKRGIDQNKINELLKLGGLQKFSDYVNRLAECCFGDGNIEKDELLLIMENYILQGKSYGTVKTNSTAYAVKNGKTQKIITLLFPKYKNMTLLFPVLKKHKLLLPFFWVYRWILAILGGRTHISVKRLTITNKIDEQDISNTKNLFKKLELI